MPDTRGISWPPPPEDRNLLIPYIPGTKAFTKRVDEIQLPNPLTTKPSENLMYDVGAVAPIAYHGTPHKFDKFDVSKIGTGQGAQAYGHGLYFAENPKVAGEYQQILSRGQSIPTEALQEYFKPGRVVSSYGGGKDVVEEFIPSGFMGGWGVKVRGEDGRLRIHATSPSEKEVESVLNAAGKQSLLDPIKGATIKADIHPSPDKFLDWDKPLSEQSEGVRKALEAHPILKEIITDRLSTVGKLRNKDSVFAKMWEGGGRGAGVYQTLSQKLGSEKAASELLNELGIPGIRYLDQGSRGRTSWIAKHPKGGENAFNTEAEALAFIKRNPETKLVSPERTYNYVVFNDKDVKILERK